MFDNLTNIIYFELRNVGLESMEQINFRNFKQLEHLDLSSNLLTELRYESFEFLSNLKFLDLNNNQISKINSSIFLKFTTTVANPLEYLNLENNKIVSFDIIFTNYLNLKTFRISKNYLIEIPRFNIYWNGSLDSSNNEFYFNQNNISIIMQFSISFYSLKILDFDSNHISKIDYNALIYLTSLTNLSIANNNLINISSNNFNSMFNLKYLNLSYNQIDSIEMDSFINLNKLISLDLSFNRLKSIESNMFRGLNYLNDLYLMNQVMFQLNDKSLSHLINVGSIYVNELMVREFKCLFIRFATNRSFTSKGGNRWEEFFTREHFRDSFR